MAYLAYKSDLDHEININYSLIETNIKRVQTRYEFIKIESIDIKANAANDNATLVIKAKFNSLVNLDKNIKVVMRYIDEQFKLLRGTKADQIQIIL